MERKELESKVKEIVTDQLIIDPREVSETDKIVEDLGADSLDCIEIVMNCEREFGIHIPDNELDSIQTIKDLCDIVEKKIGKKR